MLASPPGLSQRATPFIASQCQGIHQMPLLRSFPDIAEAMPGKTRHSQGQKPPSGSPIRVNNHLSSRVTLYSREDTLPQRQVNSSQPPAISCQPKNRDTRLGHTLFTLSKNEPAMQAHCRQTVLPRSFKRPSVMPPSPLAVTALPLSGTIASRCYAMVEVNGIEPMTSCLQSRRSPN